MPRVHLHFIFIPRGGCFYIASCRINMFTEIVMLLVPCPDLIYHADAVNDDC